MALLEQTPRYIPLEGSDRIVVFIHGIVEGPAQFLPLMDLALSEGYSVASLLLPGHGGTAKEFARNGKGKWISHVDSQIEKYRQLYEGIIVAGHSMGSLLAFISYIHNPLKINGIIAIDTPLRVHLSARAIRNNLKIGFYKNVKEDDPAYALLLASSVEPCSVFRYLTWIPRIADLFRLIVQTRKVLHRVSVPSLIVHADKDELVHMASISVFENKMLPEYRKILRLPDSNHFVYSESDFKILRDNFKQFLMIK